MLFAAKAKNLKTTTGAEFYSAPVFLLTACYYSLRGPFSHLQLTKGVIYITEYWVSHCFSRWYPPLSHTTQTHLLRD
ncbi:hypothetical protein Pan181_10650 [Aeoliella mucimassa]|uniref:Uncharacterized protein n=1 Tax=Aeoliella mucimassa TaxID=2527972 RepID=A0A518AJG5_9BACT|nr:hypothetical protein Pan181_10650 [Aeoliella mucimassa]